VTVTKVDEVNALALVTSGFRQSREPPAAPFYTVELTSSRQSDVKWSFLYVPSAKALKIVRADFSGGIGGAPATSNTWVSPSKEVVTAYGDATVGLEPFATSPEWVPSAPDARSVPWLPILAALAAAALFALLLFSRRGSKRRAARLAHD
jgi:hypothetical protein